MKQNKKQYWNKLKNFLLKKQEYKPEIPKIEIFPKKSFDNYDEYQVGDLMIKQNKSRSISINELIISNENPIDNTGVYYWPSEFILADFLFQQAIKEKQIEIHDNIIELGAGRSGFCGLLLSKLGYQVTVTDGNSDVVELLKENIEINKLNENCKAQILQWNEGEIFQNTTALIADCFFFENYHNQLISMINRFKKCIAAAPSRGGSLERFLEKCQRKFKKQEYKGVFIIIFE